LKHTDCVSKAIQEYTWLVGQGYSPSALLYKTLRIQLPNTKVAAAHYHALLVHSEHASQEDICGIQNTLPIIGVTL
jgi:hypothetical protein